MKHYIAINHLRLVGKGWEVRRELNRLSALAAEESLSDYTRTIPPIRIKLGTSNPIYSDYTKRELMLGEPDAEMHV
ncbi:hypothetical protein ACX1C1_18165 [Paenibacillus sp. strain BS8-2]